MRFNGRGGLPTPDMPERSGGGGTLGRTADMAVKRVARHGSDAGRREIGNDPRAPRSPAWSRLMKMADAPPEGGRTRARLISTRPNDPASKAFDQLRTRLLRAMRQNDWTRVAVTAPTAGCGASFTSANLALSCARLETVRTLLIDLDLAEPGLERTFGIRGTGPLEPVLYGARPPEAHLFRIGENLALGLNDEPMDEPAAWLQHPETWAVLDKMHKDLQPDVTIFDLPPMLGRDEVEAILPRVDGVLLVSDGTKTVGRQIMECERLLDGHTPLLGVILNRVDPRRAARNSARTG